ncbi:MAG: hypothetical protein H6757_02475 [Candidatus Omnitrophica bacterium]|nr:hypothetical protein [Candidatus Omnitrophota bacterium]
MKNKILTSIVIVLCLTSFCLPLEASTWSKNETYLGKTAGKLGFGLKHSLLSWVFPFKEAYDVKYDEDWEGFCMGLSKAVIFTADGLIQLVTFPIPVDFPDFGNGLDDPPTQAKGQRKTLELEAGTPPAPGEE